MHDKESGTAGNTYKNNKTGLLAVSPMFFFAALFLGAEFNLQMQQNSD